MRSALQLSLWREACRHIEIGEYAASIQHRLARQTPFVGVAVQRLNWPHNRLETVANELGRATAAIASRVELSPEEVKSLHHWGAARACACSATASGKALFQLLGGPELTGLAGPLLNSDGLSGVLILTCEPDVPLDALGEFAGELLEPFAAALENDHRLLEMKTLREAAEADRRFLLARSGRRDVSTSVVGADAGLRSVIERAEVVCRSDVPVLLLGDTGTGKEVVARVIHERSPRRGGPFIRVNCGAIPAELIDSQLFGHERGSFTGAVDKRLGWFERADGGTLFLDEIGELPLAAQVRLLRVLQDGFIERVGGQHSIHVDVRIVAATHRDLAAMSRDGAFRQDLWYRIAVFPIPIPPLRQRIEDIPALACHFAEKAATRFGLPLVMPTPEDIAALSAYSWPGNVRELAAVIDRAALLGNGRRLEIVKALGAPAAAASQVEPGTRVEPRPMSGLDEAMRAHIESALRECLGRIEGPFGAAARLGVNANTLRSRMRRLNIDWRRYRPGRAQGE